MKIKLLAGVLSMTYAITYSTTAQAGSSAANSQRDSFFSAFAMDEVNSWFSSLLRSSKTNAKITSYPERDPPICYGPDGRPIYLESRCQTLYPDPPPICGPGTSKPTCPIPSPCGRSCVVPVDPGP
jgi:hypothetical protein